MSLEKLREQFPPSLVGKLPRVTCKACSDKKCQQHKRTVCKECGSYISTAHIHLDYVGHAEVTRRLLEADPYWSWEPMAFDSKGLPALDGEGGMWIRLTVHDTEGKEVTRYGYGDSQGKRGPNAVKETIGDAIRNAAMRFGVALDLWSKERDGYLEEEGQAAPEPEPQEPQDPMEYLAAIAAASTKAELGMAGQRIAANTFTREDRDMLRSEFNARMAELKEADR